MKKIICFMFMLILMLCFSGAALAAEYVYSASVEGELSLHISPDEDSYVITKVPACSRLKLLSAERTWGLVEFRNKAGWINLSFTRSTYSKAAEATGNDSAKSVQVRAEDGRAVLYSVPSQDENLGSRAKYQIPNDTVLKITRETASGWGLVSMNGKYAWVRMDTTIPYHSETDTDQYGIYYVYVLSSEGKGLELWESADAKNLCAVIPDCIKLTVRETKGEYAYVSYAGINGWINLNYTTESLANAQSNAGVPVNDEYTLTPKDEKESVDMLSVPSDNPDDGGSVVDTIKKDESVFVLRSTASGWSLVNHDGNLGWIPPENLTLAEVEQEEDFVTIHEAPESGYISTLDGKGIKLYADISENNAVATVPESTKINIIAEKNEYKYVFCDYASGWVKDVPTAATYEESLEKYPAEKKSFYVTVCETDMMSLPTTSEICGSTVVTTVEEGKYFEVIKTAATSKNKWILTEIDGMKGWILLTHADKAEISVIVVILIILAAALVLAFAALIVHIIRRYKKNKKEVEKDEESVQTEGSGVGEESPDVSRK